MHKDTSYKYSILNLPMLLLIREVQFTFIHYRRS